MLAEGINTSVIERKKLNEYIQGLRCVKFLNTEEKIEIVKLLLEHNPIRVTLTEQGLDVQFSEDIIKLDKELTKKEKIKIDIIKYNIDENDEIKLVIDRIIPKNIIFSRNKNKSTWTAWINRNSRLTNEAFAYMSKLYKNYGKSAAGVLFASDIIPMTNQMKYILNRLVQVSESPIMFDELYNTLVFSTNTKQLFKIIPQLHEDECKHQSLVKIMSSNMKRIFKLMVLKYLPESIYDL